MACFSDLKAPPRRVALPDFPSPASPALTKLYYRRAEDIVAAAGEMLGVTIGEATVAGEVAQTPHDVPSPWYRGPF